MYNNQTDNITAENNWWGTINCSQIDAQIYDYAEDSSKGVVDYNPILNAPYPEGNSRVCSILDGDVNGDCTVNISDLAAVGLA